jgi:hypothetical protein
MYIDTLNRSIYIGRYYSALLIEFDSLKTNTLYYRLRYFSTTTKEILVCIKPDGAFFHDTTLVFVKNLPDKLTLSNNYTVNGLKTLLSNYLVGRQYIKGESSDTSAAARLSSTIIEGQISVSSCIRKGKLNRRYFWDPARFCPIDTNVIKTMPIYFHH